MIALCAFEREADARDRLKPEMDFERGLKATVEWYRSNPQWIAHVRSGEYQSYHDKNYANRNRELREIST